MLEQLELEFEPEPSLEELIAVYREKVGVPPRTNDIEAIKAALLDPEAERARLRAEDMEDDKADLRRPYRR